jgi:hypothetical protein
LTDCYTYCVGEPLKVTLGQKTVVLRVTFTVEFLDSVADEADLALESLNPVGRSGWGRLVGNRHWNEELVNECGVSKDGGRIARARSLSTLGTCSRCKFFSFLVELQPFS